MGWKDFGNIIGDLPYYDGVGNIYYVGALRFFNVGILGFSRYFYIFAKVDNIKTLL